MPLHRIDYQVDPAIFEVVNQFVGEDNTNISQEEYEKMPPEAQAMFNQGVGLGGRMHECYQLLERAVQRPPADETVNDLESITGPLDLLRALAIETAIHQTSYEVGPVYHPKVDQIFPYPVEAFNMLPVIWNVTKTENTQSFDLWHPH